jgi:hypothetical protein
MVRALIEIKDYMLIHIKPAVPLLRLVIVVDRAIGHQAPLRLGIVGICDVPLPLLDVCTLCDHLFRG